MQKVGVKINHINKLHSNNTQFCQSHKKWQETELCIPVDYSYQPEFFNILATGQKHLSLNANFFFNVHRVINFKIFLDENFFS